ncbi:hypothetical protein HDV02_004392 [Globomyces sp. JEL0801]|nr:hypothetical protein HDV02_004392 [Globomyces sp. JEL0801]
MKTNRIVVGGIPVLELVAESNTIESRKDVGLFMLHGRGGSKDEFVKKYEDFFESLLNQLPVNLHLFLFDQRNHGDRQIDEIHNKGIKTNPNHGIDMYSLQYGTANDVKYLMDTIPLFVKIDEWAIWGFSLGGHATLLALTLDDRLKVGVSVVGCGDYKTLMADRNVIVTDELQNLLLKVDPINIPQTYKNKNILLLNGGKDTLVNSRSNDVFLATVQSLTGNEKFQRIVDDDAGHVLSDLMKSKSVQWFQSHL